MVHNFHPKKKEREATNIVALFSFRSLPKQLHQVP
jgi:hypothetical protein